MNLHAIKSEIDSNVKLIMVLHPKAPHQENLSKVIGAHDRIMQLVDKLIENVDRTNDNSTTDKI